MRSDFTDGFGLRGCGKDAGQVWPTQAHDAGSRSSASVGSPAGSDFPAALVRFGACLGIEIHICDPHHPQQNGFVERYPLHLSRGVPRAFRGLLTWRKPKP